jgi:hypothetical protein
MTRRHLLASGRYTCRPLPQIANVVSCAVFAAATKAVELALAKNGRQKSISFSKVGSTVALSVLRRLDVIMHNGHEAMPLAEPPGGFVKCPAFDMSDYAKEDVATSAFLEHVKQSLQLNHVTCGSDGFNVIDLHSKSNLYELMCEAGGTQQVFKGGLDGAIVPYGVSPLMPQSQIRCGIEIKHTSKQKAQHNVKQHGLEASDTEQGTSFSGRVQGQVLMEQLAAAVYAEYPQVMLLLSSYEHNTVLLWDDGVVTHWDGISFDAAMFKVAQFLNSCDKSSRYMLDTAAQGEQHQRTVHLRKRLRQDSAVLEQLDSLTMGMDREEKHAVALEFFGAYRPQLADFGLMYS